MIEIRAFLEKRGSCLRLPTARQVKKYLLDNLARMRDDFLKYRAQPKDEGRFQLFQDRGISLDTNLWPTTKWTCTSAHGRERLAQSRQRASRRHCRPRLDFANKKRFGLLSAANHAALPVLDSLVRLGIADPPRSNSTRSTSAPTSTAHRTRGSARLWAILRVQLAWNTARP